LKAPSTFAILLAQENIWVCQTLLSVIQKCNEGATNNANAAIKRLDALDIGAQAARAWKESGETVVRIGAAAGAATGEGGMGGATAAPVTAAPSDMGGASAASGGEQGIQQLMEMRYFDDKDTPLPFDPEYPYAKHPSPEFKLMPIRMNMVMDQRQIPKLLVECANSSMPIEIRRIRILKTQGTVFDVASGGTSAASGVASVVREVGATGQTGAPLADTRHDVPVEIYGLIYIYQPPAREKMATGAAGENPAEAGAPATPAATPAAAPAANQP
jgi:hypothetical protein